MNKIHQNIIIGSGFSSFILTQFIKKNYLIITTDSELIKKYPKRSKLTKHLKLFSKKFKSYGKINFKLKKSILHDTLIHGGNTNVWGGICNIEKIKQQIKILQKILFFKNINIKETGSFSNNIHLRQIQPIYRKKGQIFNCSNYFKKIKIGHLVAIKSLNNNLLKIFIKTKKNETFYCRNLILAINFTQLVEVLFNSKIIKDKDLITLNEHKFYTTISFTKNLKNYKKNSLILSYSLSGMIKHAIGIQKNFSSFFLKSLIIFLFIIIKYLIRN